VKTKLLLFSLLMLAMGGSSFAQRIVIPSAGVVTANVNDYNDFMVNLTGNISGVTLSAPVVTPATGYQVTMRFVQDATGSRTVTFGGNITSSCTINATANSVTICRWQYTASGNTWADAGGSSSGSGASPSSAYTFSVAGGITTATSNSGGATFSNADAAVVFNQVTSALATVGGKLFFKNGVYNINSMTVETATGCSSFAGSGAALAYGIAFPANTFATSVQWLLEGESAPVWQGETLAATVNNSGVIFNITSTAVSSVAAGSILTGFWQRPVINCTLSPGSFPSSLNVSNDIHFKNMSVRFPTTTRGNEIGLAPYFASDAEYENVVADFNLPYNTIATGAAPTKGSYGSFGMTTTVSSSGNYQYFRNTFAVGYDIAYDFQSEHVIGETVTAIYNNFACEFGRSATAVFHPIWIQHFVDQENGAGCVWGPQMIQASVTDIAFDFELGNDANWYSTARNKTAKLTETNCNIGTGVIRYSTTLAGVGTIAEVPGANVFTSCGGSFTFQEVTQPLNYLQGAATDSFTRPNASSWGPAWVAIGAAINGSTAIISSNAATVSSASGLLTYLAQPTGPDQFSKATINTVDANAVTVVVRASTSASTYYDYLCATSGGQILRKRVAGTFTSLNTNATNCAVADVMELKVIGSILYAYRNGVLAFPPTSDSSITSGTPGLVIGGTGDSFTNWSGGNVPAFDPSRSLYSQPMFALDYGSVPVAVASLPAAAAYIGRWKVVNDSTAIAAEGQTCVGSSTNTALAFSNGAGWKCF
jgi:hypothetical protein